MELHLPTGVPRTKQKADLLRKKTILVVDDHPATLKSVCEFLDHDYNVLHAVNGKVALQRSKAFKPEIDLLLSDFQMSGMNR